MIKQEQRNRMRDYLVDKLEQGNGKIVSPFSKNIIGNIKTSIIVLEKGVLDRGEEVILLLDQAYTQENFERLKKSLNPSCYVFYKDGEIFFRNAGKKVNTVGKGDRSLKYYTNEQIYRMISFRPEEIAVHEARKGKLQYYQPESERLKEALVTYTFEPVQFDYSHINPHERYRPNNTESKRIYLWKNEEKTNEPLFVGNFLHPISEDAHQQP